VACLVGEAQVIFRFLGAFLRLRKASSVRPPEWNSSAPTGRIFNKFYIWAFFENISWKFKFHSSTTRITGTLHDGLYKFTIIPRWIFLRMRDVLDKVRRKSKHAFCVRKLCFHQSCLWGNVEKYGRDRQTTGDNIIWLMRCACWMPKATDTLNIFCFPRPQCDANAPLCYVIRTLTVCIYHNLL